jgi:ketosteroid isomerase-like protein
VTSEESTTPDLMRDAFEAVNRCDLDAMMSFYAPDALWESPPLGTSFEGRAAIVGGCSCGWMA